MKTNKFLGLVGVAAFFGTFAVACAAPAVQRSSGSDSSEETGSASSSKSNTSTGSSTGSTTTPSKSSTATTTATTVTDAGAAPTVPAVDFCAKVETCAENSDDIFQLAGYFATAAAGNQTACQVAYIACKANIFETNCDKPTDCCDEMTTNGNASLSNACRSKANAGDSNTCSTQLDSYQGDGRCN